MSGTEAIQDDFGATFGEYCGHRVVRTFGEDERDYRSVRSAAGVFDPPAGILVIEGDDRIEYVDNVLSNRVPTEPGKGCYGVILDPKGKIRLDMYVYTLDERLFIVLPPNRAADLADEWREKVFIQDVEIEDRSDEFDVFDIHGPNAYSTIESIDPPTTRYAIGSGSFAGTNVDITRTDGLAGETSYRLICPVEEAPDVYQSLLEGPSIRPIGSDTFSTLTVEAGTPLFESELEGRIPNVLGLRSALDFDKGCYVGQEVVSRIENRGRPGERLIGLHLSTQASVDAGDAVMNADREIGSITRTARSPDVGHIGLAIVDYDIDSTELSVETAAGSVSATTQELPFREGSELSARLPQYA